MKYRIYRITTQGYYFLPINKDKTLQIVLHCDIIRGCATIKFYTHMHTKYYLLLMINDNSYNSFSCLQLSNTWGSYIQGYMDIWYRWAIGTVSWRWRQSQYFCSSCYYDRIYRWARFESNNLPSLSPIKFTHVALFKGLQLKLIKVICIQIVTYCSTI